MPQELPYGSWPSPISAELVAAGGVGVSGPAVRGDTIWWSELRPTEGGRSVPVRSAIDGTGRLDALADPWSARTRAHEYGGGAWWLGADHLYVANWSDQRLYRVPIDGDGSAEPEAVTAEPAMTHGWRWADGREHPDGTWLVAVREDHHAIGAGEDARREAANELVAVPLGVGADPVVLVSGPDFVAAPRFSPDGRGRTTTRSVPARMPGVRRPTSWWPSPWASVPTRSSWCPGPTSWLLPGSRPMVAG